MKVQTKALVEQQEQRLQKEQCSRQSQGPQDFSNQKNL